MATPQRGEAVKHVINHCFKTFCVLGRPMELKTDNGPAYTSSQFAQFCQRWNVVHKFGIPYNPQGQAIVERANGTLKTALEKQKTKTGETLGPGLPIIQNILNITLFTLNFLNLTGQLALTVASRHFASSPSAGTPRPEVRYRKLPDPTWRGPVPLITWGRGYAAIEDGGTVIWVPVRCVRPYHPTKGKGDEFRGLGKEHDDQGHGEIGESS